ncbi:MAG: hypothetical protein DRI54_05730 [Bacteroidetes bacterium]|nr:MAG: hypothetical protein DRI54_05730 [Bacteroidota bacterium]
MEKIKCFPIILFLIIFSINCFSQSDSTVTVPKKYKRLTVGFEIDALPYITGGYYASVWLGFKKQKQRLRPVYAKVNVPEFLLDEYFNRNTLIVYAIVVDYFFKPNFEKFWIGTGIEYWDGEIENMFSETAKYNNWIFTLGGGYVWKFWDNLYINPWVAGHLRIAGDEEVQVGLITFYTPFITPEISLKLGWNF